MCITYTCVTLYSVDVRMIQGLSIKRSIWERLFRFSVVIFFVLIVAYIYLFVSQMIIRSQIDTQSAILTEKNAELDTIAQMTGFVKFNLVKVLEEGIDKVSWSDRIAAVIGMIDSLRSLDTSSSDTVSLSDFSVSLNQISLRGRVTNLLLLYFTAPERNFVSLIDRFSSLDFIQDMRIQSYTKRDDGSFEFVLQANVRTDDK